MNRNLLPADQARRVTPRALRVYAQALGWQPVEGVNGQIAVYHAPGAKARQVIIPLDEGFDDYAEVVAEAVLRLAEFEQRPPGDVLEHLLLPPSDLLSVCDTGPEAADGTLPLGQAADLLAGSRKALLAQAHSVLQPRPFHPRLSRTEAERFVHACRLGQTRRGSFTVVLACPLDAVPTQANLFEHQEPFTRQVTAGLMQTLSQLANAADQGSADKLLRPEAHPLLSANLCEALLQMRPGGDRPSLTISAAWSRSALPPVERALPSAVNLHHDAFDVAEYLAVRLRSAPQPVADRFIGFVDVLRGQPGPDDRPVGEVMVTIFQGDELIKAWLDLDATDYATADRAHMSNSPVVFRGVLYRSPRIGRVTQFSNFRMLEPQSADQASPQAPVS